MSDLVHGRNAIARAARATRYLLVLSIILMAALAMTFAYLIYRQRELQESIREDALWAVYQLNREARALSEASTKVLIFGAGDGSKAVDTLTLRYDILYSRLSILENAKYASFFTDSEKVDEARRSIRELVLSLAPTFDAIAGNAPDGLSPALLAQLGDLQAPMERLGSVTADLVTYTNGSLSAVRADARSEIIRLQTVAAATVLALIVATAVLVFSLKRQVHLVEVASNQLETIARELTTAYEAADAGNRAKSEFMATIGHEIRTPLNAVLGMAELLSAADLPPQDKANVHVIARSGTALLEIINEILDFAKLEHGDTPTERVPFSLDALVRDASDVMQGRAREQGNIVLIDIAPALRGRHLIGDPARLRRVLLNLLSNAVKFTSGGAITLRLSEFGGEERPVLRVSVSDEGIGIPTEAREKLFKAFSQVDGTISRRFGGTGLGLAICKRIVESLGGRIGVDSEVGRGSTFWFEVPLEDAPEHQRAEPVVQADGAAVLPRLHILLVEDNAVNREVACQFLAKLEQRVTVATDGAEAVAAASGERFDLILMDMQMPVLDGIAATREIRRLDHPNRDAPIVAITANASDSDRSLCLSVGMTGFEVKPVSFRRLRELIASHGAGSAACAPPPAPALAAIDRERRGELIEAVGEEGFRALADMFFEDAAVLLHDLSAATTAHDDALFDRTLHSLKGAAANLGFAAFAATAQARRADGPTEATASGMRSEVANLADLYRNEAA